MLKVEMREYQHLSGPGQAQLSDVVPITTTGGGYMSLRVVQNSVSLLGPNEAGP